MGTDIRPELSKKNKYWLEKHRYYELKHFCLQYPIWKKAYLALTDLSGRPLDIQVISKSYAISDPTRRIAEARLFYENRMKMVENTAEQTDKDLCGYILIAVTQGKSYDSLRTNYNIPCCRDVYYQLYRKFFSLLSEERE